MSKKERAPKKEKPTKRDKEILKKSAAERRENRKSKGITAIITIVVVLLLIGISTVVGLVVKDSPSDSPDEGTGVVHNREWLVKLLNNYDSTLDYLTKQGYVAGTDFEAEYDVDKSEDNEGLVGSIKMTDASGYFQIYYFENIKSAEAYFRRNIAESDIPEEDVRAKLSQICIIGNGETFYNLFWNYYKIQ